MINLAWDHNSYYQPRLLRALPARCERVLDVGCGAGDFAIRLAGRAGRVDAVDRSAAMIEAARRAVPANVTCLQGDVAEMTLPVGAYDAITSISALHQMSLPTVLPRLGQGTTAGRPSGRDHAPPARHSPRLAARGGEHARQHLPARRPDLPLLWRCELLWRKPER